MDKDNFLLMPVHQLINPKTGNKYKDDNLKTKHRIPLGRLVEVKFETWHTGGACELTHGRFWVAKHSRDCDGTPLYDLSKRKIEEGLDFKTACRYGYVYHGFIEKDLKLVKVTKKLKDGYDALSWDED